MLQIKKRDGSFEDYCDKKVISGAKKAYLEAYGEWDDYHSQDDLDSVLEFVESQISQTRSTDPGYIPTVDGIQNLVEKALMARELHEAAKAYILYRAKQQEERKSNIFKKRVNLKPYEYPHLLEYKDAIQHSYWLHTEFNFTSDVQNFHVNMTEHEKGVITRTMLAISQIEVAVKSFWGKLADKLPKPEIGAVGATFSESEVRHHDAYSHLLEVLGLNEEFENIKDHEPLNVRVEYLEQALANASSSDKRRYSESILLFSLFIEHVSLFSQFLIMMSFNKFVNKLKGISNVVEATSKEEQIHGNFGIDLIRIIKEENPTWFDEKHAEKVQKLCRRAFEAEEGIIDWIFDGEDLSFLSAYSVKEFLKDRFNRSLASLDIDPVLDVDVEELEKTEWFDDEIIGTKHTDFFNKRPVNYTKKSKSFDADDLF